MELDIPFGIVSVAVVVYRITTIMSPMLKEAWSERNIEKFFRALTLLV